MDKLLVSDYDNTFHVSDTDIYENIEAVEDFRKKDNKFIIATGRAFPDMKKKLKQFPIKYDYLILGHGTIIIDNSNRILYSCVIPEEVVKELYKDIDSYEGYSSKVLYGKKKKYTNKPHYKNITKILIRCTTKTEADEILKKINIKFKEHAIAYRITVSKKNLVEVISNKTNKSNAINKIMEIEEIPKNYIYVIGDDNNDIEMITEFDGYCMEDSIERVKKICNKQVPSVRELIREIANN